MYYTNIEDYEQLLSYGRNNSSKGVIVLAADNLDFGPEDKSKPLCCSGIIGIHSNLHLEAEDCCISVDEL